MPVVSDDLKTPSCVLTNADDSWLFVDGVAEALTEDYDDNDDYDNGEDSRLYVHAAAGC